MDLLYANKKLKTQCTNIAEAKKLFNGKDSLAISLLARINALKQAETIKDVIVQPSFHFHDLKNKKRRNLDGYFAIDVKGRKDGWRIILQPLDDNEKPYDPCKIDQIAGNVRVVEISEVSNHYE